MVKKRKAEESRSSKAAESRTGGKKKMKREGWSAKKEAADSSSWWSAADIAPRHGPSGHGRLKWMDGQITHNRTRVLRASPAGLNRLTRREEGKKKVKSPPPSRWRREEDERKLTPKKSGRIWWIQSILNWIEGAFALVLVSLHQIHPNWSPLSEMRPSPFCLDQMEMKNEKRHWLTFVFCSWITALQCTSASMTSTSTPRNSTSRPTWSMWMKDAQLTRSFR